jgi:hypothetical protein
MLALDSRLKEYGRSRVALSPSDLALQGEGQIISELQKHGGPRIECRKGPAEPPWASVGGSDGDERLCAHRGRNGLCLAVMLIATLFPIGTLVRAGPPAAFVSWFHDARASAIGVRPPETGNVRIECRLEFHNHLSAAQIAELRERVRSFPQHPDRALLEEAERRLRQGPDVDTLTFWYVSPVRWRINNDSNYVNFFDTASDGERKWQASEAVLSLLDASEPAIQETMDGGRRRIEDMLLLIRHGGLDRTRTAEPGSIQLEFLGPTWRARMRNERGASFHISGLWHTDEGYGVTERIEVFGPDQPRPSTVLTFHDHVKDPHLGPIARRVTLRSPLVHWDLHVTGVSPQSRREVDRALAQPSPRRGAWEDPARGARQVTQVRDHRNRRHIMTVISAEGEEVVPMAEAARSGGARLQWAGWGIAGAIVIGFALLWLPRRNGA